MRHVHPAVLCCVLATSLAAQPPEEPQAKRPSATSVPSAAVSLGAINDLPVRKVVLYKNGVGYFEHAGTVNGSQRVAIDFTSSQLNDVLQSLTALDNRGGKVSAVGYNSTTPIEQQLNALSLGLKDYPATLDVYHALRGQRVEITGVGAAITGRLVNVEYRKQTDKNGVSSDDHYFLIVESDSGALRTAEISDAVSVRMIDPALQKQFASYLEIIGSGQNQQGRHLTLEDRGEGERQLQVSYISEVPVWKSTYRIVFPRDPNGAATLQGWAVVDNTVGVDWNNVQLSLVAGAPQSFIQPLSQPLYTHRPTIPIATIGQNMPVTHEAAESITVQSEMMSNQLMAPAQIPRDMQSLTAMQAPQQQMHGAGVVGGLFSNGANMAGLGSGMGSGYGGGVYRASDAIQQGDVSTNAFDDFFEYAISQPVTIHKNESAMVPILQQELPARHMTLWSDRQPTPLRTIWLENNSKLTLDSGSFSIFENGEFAGEGLLDPIHPGEKRLLSYAVDQAVKVRPEKFNDTRTLRHIAVHDGMMVETTSEVTENTYSITNAADQQRAVLIEHARRGNAELASDTKPEETTATAYRFRVGVEPHQTAKLEVKERASLEETVEIGTQTAENSGFLVTVSKYSLELEQKLRPAMDAESALANVNNKLEQNSERQKTLTADEMRDRDNVTALKGNDAAKRFIEELTQAEDDLQAARKEQADLEKQRDAAQEKLNGIIAKLSFDTGLDVVTSRTD
jgi:hypothetical protein